MITNYSTFTFFPIFIIRTFERYQLPDYHHRRRCRRRHRRRRHHHRHHHHHHHLAGYVATSYICIKYLCYGMSCV